MQAKGKCQSGSISILARSRALAWLGLAGEPLWRSAVTVLPTLLQSDHRYLPEAQPLPSWSATGACVGLLGWWESKRRALKYWWDSEGFQGPSWGWERKPPNRLGKSRVEDVLQAYARRSLRASRPLQKLNGLCNCLIAERSLGCC